MLNEQRRLFVDKYIESFNASKAYIEAGYKAKHPDINAYKLLQNKAIQEYISVRLKMVRENSIAKTEEILQFLTDCLRGDIVETNYFMLRSGTTGRDGSYYDELVTRETPIKIKERLKAAEILAKIHKLMDGNNIDGSTKIVFNYNIPEKNEVLEID